MEVGSGDLVSKKSFGAKFKLHVEFRVPFMPEAKGVDRGNSGVFLLGEREIQILDSYGIKEAGVEDCGALYGVKAPLSNACKPPSVWQTFDIVFIPAWFDTGEKRIPAQITVHHNGVLIHDRLPLDMNTKDSGPIMLQQYGHAVQFRNIWLLPLTK